jgi:hypothetical protein
MIRGLALAAVVHLLCGALGWPVDAALPVAVAFGLGRGPVAARVLAALVVAALAALASGDVVTSRVVAAGVAVVGSAILSDRVEDHVGTRVLFTALAFGATVGARVAVAWVGSAPPPADGAVAIGLTAAFAGLHAAVSGAPWPALAAAAPSQRELAT